MSVKIVTAVLLLLILAGAGNSLNIGIVTADTTVDANTEGLAARGTGSVEISGVNYMPHSPIIINGNENFTYENGVVAGSGTDDDPYVIEGWSIKGFLSGIEIRNTDADFIIRDCYLNDSLLCELGSAGVHLVNVTNGIITGNVLHENMYGVWLLRCGYISITGNTVNNTMDLFMPCYLIDCQKITFLNNTFKGKGAGIYLHISDEVIIEHNTFMNNDAAIRMWRSSNSFVGFNDMINCSSLRFEGSENNTIYSNNFININESRLVEEDQLGTNNCWYDGYFRGNYWSNYSGLDDGSGGRKSGDGVGDTGIPHLGIDNYPLIEPYASGNGNDKIIITLFSTKPLYDEGETITGTLSIYNNNPFDIEFIEVRDPLMDLGVGVFIEIRSRSELITYAALTDDIKPPIKISGYEQKDIEFRIEDIYIMPFKTNDTILAPGSYHMYSYLYYGNKTDHQIIYSNRVSIEVVEDITGFKNLSIELELTGTEFYVDEHITGTLTFTNDNPFDMIIDVSDTLDRAMGAHFVITAVSAEYREFSGINEKDLYPIEISANDQLMVNFTIVRTNVRSQQHFKTESEYLDEGDYSIFAEFTVGNIADYRILYSNTKYFSVIDNRTASGGDGDADGVPEWPGAFSTSFILETVFAVTIIVIVFLTIFIAATEVGKYSFYSAVAPLYTKQRRKKDENYGYIRGLVLGYIDGNPGESYNSIKRALELNNGALAYHLKVLEREDQIHSERDGSLKRFYPKDGRISREVIELTDLQQDIYDMIKADPGISQAEIQDRMDISQQRLNYQVKQMSDARLIRVEREGKRTRCYVIDEDQ